MEINSIFDKFIRSDAKTWNKFKIEPEYILFNNKYIVIYNCYDISDIVFIKCKLHISTIKNTRYINLYNIQNINRKIDFKISLNDKCNYYLSNYKVINIVDIEWWF